MQERTRKVLVFSILSLVILGGVAAQSSSTFSVNDDLDAWFDTVFDFSDPVSASAYKALPNATILGNLLEMSVSPSPYKYTLKQSGIKNSNDSRYLKTSNLSSTGRYTVNWTKNGSSITETSLDIIDMKNADVAGRVIDGSNEASFSVDSSDIVFRYWLNKSEFRPSSINVSSDPFSTTDDLFRTNIGQQKYWIGFNKTNYTHEYDFYQSGASMPRLNDLYVENQFDSGNISVKVVNYTGSKDRGVVNDAEVRVRRMYIGKSKPSRIPYFTAPPTLTKFTENGWANFTEVPAGRYDIDVTNESLGRTSYRSFRADVPSGRGQISSSNSAKITINVTDWTGNVSGSIEGPRSSNIKYIVGVMNRTKGIQKIKFGVDPDSFSITGIPNGTYQLAGARFNTSEKNPKPQIATKQIQVRNDGFLQNRNLSFPVNLVFDGNVTNSTGSAIKDAKVIAENREELSFGFDTTDSNGEFSMKLRNDTDYDIKVIPPGDTDYKVLEKNVTLNSTKSEYHLNYSFTLSKGSVIEGEVSYSNKPVDAEIVAWNGTEESFDRDLTDSSGNYRLTGLKKNTTYRLRVNSFEAGVPDRTISYETNSTRVLKRDFSLNKKYGNLTVEVRNTSGNSIGATVKVLNNNVGISRQNNSAAGGDYNFTDLPQQTFYRVKAIPDQAKYVPETRSLTLFGNTTDLTFNLSEEKFVNGYVYNGTSDAKKAIADVRVLGKNEGENSFGSDTTDSNGFYNITLKGSDEFNHTFKVLPSGDTYYSKRLEINVSDLSSSRWNRNFTLSTGQELNGTILTGSGGSVSTGEIFVYNQTRDVYKGEEFNNGNYSLEGLNPDIGYNVFVEGSNDQINSTTTSISSTTFDTLDSLGYVQNFTLANRSGRKLRITVKDRANSNTLANASVIVNGVEKTTGSAGKVTYGEQSQGQSVNVVVRKDDYLANATSFTIKNKTTTVAGRTETNQYQNETVYLKNPSEVDIQVNVTKNGNLFSDALIEFRANKSGVAQTSSGITGSNGETSITDLVVNSTDYGGEYLVTLVTPDDSVYQNTTRLLNSSANLDVKSFTMGSGTYKLWTEVPE